MLKKIKLLLEIKLIIRALGNLHYRISNEKFEHESEFEPRASAWLKWHSSQEGDLKMGWHENQDSSSGRAPIRIPVQVRIFLFRSDNFKEIDVITLN